MSALAPLPGNTQQMRAANGAEEVSAGQSSTPKIWRLSTYLQRLGHPGLSYQLGKQPTHEFKVRAPCSLHAVLLCPSPWCCSVPSSSCSQGSKESVRPGAPARSGPLQTSVMQGLWHQQTTHKSSKVNFELYWFLYFAFRSGLHL